MPSPGHIASPVHPPHPARRAMIPHVISPRQGHVRPWAGWPWTGRRLPRPGQGGGSRRVGLPSASPASRPWALEGRPVPKNRRPSARRQWRPKEGPEHRHCIILSGRQKGNKFFNIRVLRRGLWMPWVCVRWPGRAIRARRRIGERDARGGPAGFGRDLNFAWRARQRRRAWRVAYAGGVQRETGHAVTSADLAGD